MSTRADIIFENDEYDTIREYPPIIYMWGDGTPECVTRLLIATKKVTDKWDGYAGATGAISNLFFIGRLWSLQSEFRKNKKLLDDFLNKDIFKFMAGSLLDLDGFDRYHILRFTMHIFPMNDNDRAAIDEGKWYKFREAHYLFYIRIKDDKKTDEDLWTVKIVNVGDNKVIYDGDAEKLFELLDEYDKLDDNRSFEEFLLDLSS